MSACKTLSRICVSTRQSPTGLLAATHRLPLVHLRHESTTRRHKKLLALPEAPSFTPARASPTLIFNPPSAAPNVYHTPLKFLPKSDKRRALYATHLAASTQAAYRTHTSPIAAPGTPLHTSTSASSHLPPRPSASLPPALRTPYEKKYHLTDTDIAEMQRLRREDPNRWTRVRLAEKFGCSQFFVGMVAKHEGKAVRVRKAHERSRERWGEGRRLAREDRSRRREGWGRDA